MSVRIARVVASALAFTLWVAGVAVAQAPNNPVGLWFFQAYNDNSPNLVPMGSQNICFVANGTWYGTTFPNWNGRWFQKGNNLAGNGNLVRILGNWAFGAGNDSADISFVNLSLMTGGWHEWTDGFGAVLWIQIRGQKLGNACPLPASSDSVAVSEAERRPWEEKGADEPVCPAP